MYTTGQRKAEFLITVFDKAVQQMDATLSPVYSASTDAFSLRTSGLLPASNATLAASCWTEGLVWGCNDDLDMKQEIQTC